MRIEHYIACVSLAWLVTQHATFRKLHLYLFNIGWRDTGQYAKVDDKLTMYTERNTFRGELSRFVYNLITCSYCVSFWSAVLLSMFLCCNGIDLIINGLESAIFSLIVCTGYMKIFG